jgi:hypothetical protein
MLTHTIDAARLCAGTRLLALGFDVSPSSLALAGSTIYWTQGVKPESASLS